MKCIFDLLPSATAILSGIGTIAATFTGAWFAFQFAKHQRDVEKKEKNITAGNVALFTLFEMLDSMRQYQKEVVDGQRDRDDAWLNLNASSPLRGRDLSFNVDALAFLLQTYGSVFQKLILEERRFKLLALIVEQHSEHVFKEVWPLLSSAGVKVGEQISGDKIAQILGPGIFKRLKVLAEAIIKNTDENVISATAVLDALRIALVKRYPDGKFIRYNLNPKPEDTV